MPQWAGASESECPGGARWNVVTPHPTVIGTGEMAVPRPTGAGIRASSPSTSTNTTGPRSATRAGSATRSGAVPGRTRTIRGSGKALASRGITAWRRVTAAPARPGLARQRGPAAGSVAGSELVGHGMGGTAVGSCVANPLPGATPATRAPAFGRARPGCQGPRPAAGPGRPTGSAGRPRGGAGYRPCDGAGRASEKAEPGPIRGERSGVQPGMPCSQGQDLPGPDRDLPEPDRDLPGPGRDLPGPGRDLPGPGRDLPGPGRDLPGTGPGPAGTGPGACRDQTRGLSGDRRPRPSGTGPRPAGTRTTAFPGPGGAEAFRDRATTCQGPGQRSLPGQDRGPAGTGPEQPRGQDTSTGPGRPHPPARPVRRCLLQRCLLQRCLLQEVPYPRGAVCRWPGREGRVQGRGPMRPEAGYRADGRLPSTGQVGTMGLGRPRASGGPGPGYGGRGGDQARGRRERSQRGGGRLWWGVPEAGSRAESRRPVTLVARATGTALGPRTIGPGSEDRYGHDAGQSLVHGRKRATAMEPGPGRWRRPEVALAAGPWNRRRAWAGRGLRPRAPLQRRPEGAAQAMNPDQDTGAGPKSPYERGPEAAIKGLGGARPTGPEPGYKHEPQKRLRARNPKRGAGPDPEDH